MLKRLFVPALVGTLLLAGCDLIPTAVSPDRVKQVQDEINKQQQANKPPAAQPTAGAPATGSNPFRVGQKWVYAINVDAAGVKMSGEVTNEVVSVNGAKAEIKSSSQIGPASATTVVKTVDVSAADPYAGLVMDQSMAITSGPTFTDESVTVAAGTFAARKAAYVGTKDGAEMTVNSWATKDLGVIKYNIVTKIAAPALPAGLPGGFGSVVSNLSTTTSVELKSFTK